VVLIVQLTDDYVIKPKDLITHGGYTNQQVLQVHTVNPAEGLAYQKIGV
jgi:imidazolonepropionase-like amidohydrolase